MCVCVWTQTSPRSYKKWFHIIKYTAMLEVYRRGFQAWKNTDKGKTKLWEIFSEVLIEFLQLISSICSPDHPSARPLSMTPVRYGLCESHPSWLQVYTPGQVIHLSHPHVKHTGESDGPRPPFSIGLTRFTLCALCYCFVKGIWGRRC